METLFAHQKDVKRLLTPFAANEAVEKAFIAYGLGQVQLPAKSYLYFGKGDLRSMPAYIFGQGMDIAGIKSVNVHPGNSGYNLPTVMAVIILVDPSTGFPLAVLDGTYLTAMRTGAAGALAAKLLSRQDSRTAGFIGCGVQARTQLTCLTLVRSIQHIKVWKRSGKSRSAEKFASWAENTFDLKSEIFENIEDVSASCDILVTTTPSDKPLVTKVSPGAHINAMGADAKGKQEISLALLEKTRIIVDNWEQASHSGEINTGVAGDRIKQSTLYAELGEIAAGTKEGRTSSEEITLFDSTGLAIQDIACGYRVYKVLKEEKARKRINFF